MNIYQCSHIGVSGTTEVHTICQADGTWEARCGIALFGMTNMDEAGFAACDANPFHEKFYDNYASGKGETEQEAIEAMKKDMQSISNGIWAV